MTQDRNRHFIYIDSEHGLRGLGERMRALPRVALDTEADSLHHYYAKTCLIQLAAGGENYIVDPLAGVDLSGFFRTLAGKEIVIHGADYDLRMLRSSFDFHPRGRIFDTMLAAQLLGYEKLGLAALVKDSFDVTLTKGSQKADWSRRPLREKELCYASDDTRYLEPLADFLLDKLRELGREEWHRETCDALVESTRTDRTPADPDEVWRIKGLNGLGRVQLAYVRGLWRWREKEAQQADRPPFKIMGNALILELALWAESHPDKRVEEGPKLPRTCKEGRLAALEKTIGEIRRLPADRRPDLKKKKRRAPTLSDRERRQLEVLRNGSAGIAEDLGIDPSVLASRATLQAIVRDRPRTLNEIMRSGSITQWQARLLVDEIKKVLNPARDS